MTGTGFCIGGRIIGEGHAVYIVAELSANHKQDFDKAVKMIYAAKDAGVDAIKLQTYTADTLTIQSDRECFRIGGGTLWDGRTLYDLYREAYTPWEWQPRLKALANELGMDLFSSAFDASAVDFLEQMNVPVHKLASPELVDIPLVQKMARTGKPLILSTGMATVEEIDEAVAAARAAGATQIALLRCTSAYPADPEEMNLRSIPDLVKRFGLPVGLSDHTPGIAVSVAAVALGAVLIEKHLTISRAAGGPDSAFSLEPDEFKSLVDAVRSAEKSLGEVHYGVSPREARTRPYRRSSVCGECCQERRPSHGGERSLYQASQWIASRHLPEILGQHASRDIESGTPMTWDLVERS